MVESDELIYSRFLADHNEEDFRVLLERHRESLMLFIYSFVHNMDDAEDLMIDAFARIMMKKPAIRLDRSALSG